MLLFLISLHATVHRLYMCCLHEQCPLRCLNQIDTEQHHWQAEKKRKYIYIYIAKTLIKLTLNISSRHSEFYYSHLKCKNYISSYWDDERKILIDIAYFIRLLRMHNKYNSLSPFLILLATSRFLPNTWNTLLIYTAFFKSHEQLLANSYSKIHFFFVKNWVNNLDTEILIYIYILNIEKYLKNGLYSSKIEISYSIFFDIIFASIETKISKQLVY